MKILVVYDSVFGNTEKIAQTIGSAVGSRGEVRILRVGEVTSEELSAVGALFVGSPTRGFRPTPAVTNLLKGISAVALKGVRVAAFDTRISMSDTKSPILRFLVGLFGYAAKPIADRLQRKGGQLALSPEGFIVKGTEGPLAEGELERAAAWAKGLPAA